SVGMSAVSITSLIPTGTPASGPRCAACACACASASSRFSQAQARTTDSRAATTCRQARVGAAESVISEPEKARWRGRWPERRGARDLAGRRRTQRLAATQRAAEPSSPAPPEPSSACRPYCQPAAWTAKALSGGRDLAGGSTLRGGPAGDDRKRFVERDDVGVLLIHVEQVSLVRPESPVA